MVGMGGRVASSVADWDKLPGWVGSGEGEEAGDVPAQPATNMAVKKTTNADMSKLFLVGIFLLFINYK